MSKTNALFMDEQESIFAELVEALEALLPSNVSVENCNIPDDETVPVDMTLGDIRAARAALAKAQGK